MTITCFESDDGGRLRQKQGVPLSTRIAVIGSLASKATQPPHGGQASRD